MINGRLSLDLSHVQNGGIGAAWYCGAASGYIPKSVEANNGN